MIFIRLDDASDYMDIKKWQAVEDLLDKYGVKPIVGIIPDNQDPDLLKYCKDKKFWEKAKGWQEKGWTIALHGFHHKYLTDKMGVNPFWRRSEFAGVPANQQCEMLRDGEQILKRHGLDPIVFFAPSHTFDKNTIMALKNSTKIRVVSDTIATDIYFKDGIYYMPQQVGRLRNNIFNNTTKCVHPNEITKDELKRLEKFIKNNEIGDFKNIELRKRRRNPMDIALKKIFFCKRRISQRNIK